MLYLADASVGFTPDDLANVEQLRKKSHNKIIIVWNKCDMCLSQNSPDKTDNPHDQSEENPLFPACIQTLPESLAQKPQVFISARTGFGIAKLVATVHNALAGQKETARQQAGLGSERQKIAVDDALDSVSHALTATDEQLGLDAVVQDIEDALASLSLITGETSPDDILGNIFSRFCVGK